MKKSNKKQIPKVRLPKFSPGGNANFNESMYDSSQSTSTQGTKDAYNKKRSKSSGLGNASNYAIAAANTAGNYVNVANDPNLNSAQRTTGYTNAANQTADAVVGAIPVYGQLFGAAKGVSDMALSAGTKSNIDPNTGEKAYQGKFGSTAAVLATPTHTNQITAWGKLLGGDTSAKNLLSSFTDPTVVGAIDAMTTKKDKYGDNQKAIDAKNKEAEEAYNQQQATYQQQQTDFINNAVQSGMANYQNQNQNQNSGTIQYGNGGVQYANGGDGQINAEVEKEENSVAPNGQFTQFNGPSHAAGGIKTDIPQNSLIFSDKLKMPGTKKTFADLNKSNNTNKEDKILSSDKHGNISKHTAMLMSMAKNKNSETLFANQESFKQAKVQAYAKRMGVTLPQAQEVPEEGMQYAAMGGVKLPMYDGGGLAVNAQGLTKPQYLQAQQDSAILYKSGLGKVPNYKYPGFEDAQSRLLNTSFITSGGKEYVIPRSIQGGTGTSDQGRPDYNGIEQYKQPSMSPWQQVLPTDSRVGATVVNNPNVVNTKLNTANWQTNQQLKGGGNKLTYADGTTQMVAPKKVTPGLFDLPQKKYGGMNLPKYGDGIKTPQSSYNPNVPEYMRYNDSGNLVSDNGAASDDRIIVDDENDIVLANDAIDRTHGWDHKNPKTAPGYKKTSPSDKFDWNNLASNVATGLANNAGNIYNLSRYNKAEVEKYDRAKASYLNDTAAMRDADAQTRRAEYNVRGASGGNAGTYLSNRVALNTENIMNKDRIRQQYANANAGIANQNSQFNTDISMREVIANAQNRARNRSGKGEAIGSMGSNIANQIMDNKKGNMDQETLQLMMKYYDTPEFQKVMKDSKYNKKKTSK